MSHNRSGGRTARSKRGIPRKASKGRPGELTNVSGDDYSAAALREAMRKSAMRSKFGRSKRPRRRKSKVTGVAGLLCLPRTIKEEEDDDE